MFKTTAIDTLKQDKKCQACWYMILSTMSGSTTLNTLEPAVESVFSLHITQKILEWANVRLWQGDEESLNNKLEQLHMLDRQLLAAYLEDS
jgi:hypothetical protein